MKRARVKGWTDPIPAELHWPHGSDGKRQHPLPKPNHRLLRMGISQPEAGQLVPNREDLRRQKVGVLRNKRVKREPVMGPLGVVSAAPKKERLTGARARHEKHGTTPWRRPTYSELNPLDEWAQPDEAEML